MAAVEDASTKRRLFLEGSVRTWIAPRPHRARRLFLFVFKAFDSVSAAILQLPRKYRLARCGKKVEIPHVTRHSGVRMAGGEMAPLRPWLGDGAKSAIKFGLSARRHT